MDVAEPKAAVAMVRASVPRESILLIRRSERPDDSWSGHWSFPGGRRDPEDSDLLQTALRELEEECSIHLDREYMITALPPALAGRRSGPFVLVAPFVYAVDRVLPAVVDDREAVEAVWVPLDVWRDPARHSLRAVPRLPENWLFPAIELNGVPVWGFTYRLATDWLGLLPAQSPVELAGFEQACRVLDFLLSLGLSLKRGWEDGAAQPGAEGRRPAKVAIVEGAIPVAPVLAHFTMPGKLFPRINVLEIRADMVRVVGLAFEEYLITVSS